MGPGNWTPRPYGRGGYCPAMHILALSPTLEISSAIHHQREAGLADHVPLTGSQIMVNLQNFRQAVE